MICYDADDIYVVILLVLHVIVHVHVLYDAIVMQINYY